MKKLFVLLFVLVSVLYACQSKEAVDVPATIRGEIGQAASSVPGAAEKTVVASTGAVELHVVARQWSFDPATIELKKGARARIVFTSADVTHGFFLTGYDRNIKIIPGEETVLEFTPDKAGEFEFYCSVPCGEGHAGMKGLLVVK